MSDQVFRFEVGKFRCMVIDDGTITDQDPSGKRPVHVHQVNCLLIDSGEHRVLVDTGCGNGFQATAGKLLGNLEAAGVGRNDIDRIIFTHGHLDHTGGAFTADGQPIYPRAHFMATRREWECLETRPETSELQHMFFAGARKHCLAMPDRFDLLDDGVTEVLPGIRVVPAPGHTPGLIMLELVSEENRLFCIGDVIHSLIEFTEPEYYALFDVTPEEAVRTRARVLSEAAASGVLVYACHFAFPGLGHIVKEDGIFDWRPVTSSQ
jgi:glyoxylase-like metal-dependent hydrolase (beta-lactamase superfamily II)